MSKSVKIGLAVLGSILLIGGGYLLYVKVLKDYKGDGVVDATTKRNTVKVVR